MVDGRGQVKRAWGWRLVLSASWLGLIVMAALLAPWIAPKDPLAQDLFLGRLPPFWVSGTQPGFYLGTDSLGRDVLSRILHGTRIALTVALVAGSITCVMGATLGLGLSWALFQAEAPEQWKNLAGADLYVKFRDPASRSSVEGARTEDSRCEGRPSPAASARVRRRARRPGSSRRSCQDRRLCP